VDTITAGEEVRLNYRIEKDGEPIMDLEPFLDAAIHFAIVPASLNTLLHRHGVVAEASHNEEESGGMMEMKEDEHMDDMAMESLEGIHIMSDGSVMLGNGDALHDASVTADGKIKLGSGRIVEPMMDMRSNDSMEDMDTGMEGMTHHGNSVPEFFGPELQSDSIVFPTAGVYQVFAQVKHEGKIIFSSFMVDVQEGFDEATAQAFDLTVANQSLSIEIVTVTQGDKIIFRVSTDEAGEFHIAGYEIEKEMKLNGIVEMRFTANLAGRYSLELHPAGSEDDIVIGAFVVNPR